MQVNVFHVRAFLCKSGNAEAPYAHQEYQTDTRGIMRERRTGDNAHIKLWSFTHTAV